MSATAGLLDKEFIDFLVQQIINLPQGMPCFLCETMHGQECIWDKIGGEMLSEGNKILDWYKKSNVQSTEAKIVLHATISTITIPV